MVWPFKHKHRAPTGYLMNDAPYGSVSYRGTDGMGTGHYAVVVKCVTCGKPFALACFHVPKDKPLTA